MRLKLISCEILYREICAVVARSRNQVDLEFLPKALHDMGGTGMRDGLQTALDRVDESAYDRVLFGYALCGNCLAGLRARSLPLVIPRAHDCITLFLGSAARYLEYFNDHPGVYFKTTGWIERGQGIRPLDQMSLFGKSGAALSFDELVARYGEDNARFLFEELGNYTRHYSQLTFIETGVEPDDTFERHTREEALRQGWKYEKVRGDLSLMQRLVDGDWNDADFLTVPPRWRVVATYDGGIIAAEEPAP